MLSIQVIDLYLCTSNQLLRAEYLTVRFTILF